MKQLFISYAHVDKWQVKSLAEILKTANYDPWYDHRLTAGLEWKLQLQEGITQCDAFVYALTPESVNSEWCQWEFKQAVEQQKPIVPILLQANTKLPDALSIYQYADFTDGPNNFNIAKLIGDIQSAIDYIPPYKPTIQAPEHPDGIPGRAINQHVFISYSKKNQVYARRLVHYLRENGFNVWIDDEINYGEDWWDVIEQAINDAGAFIAVMSPDSHGSKWVKREILLAEKRQKPILPMLYAGEEWSRFLDIQYIDVSDNTLPQEDFLRRLGQHIPRLKSRGENVTPNIKQAVEVARKQATKPFIFVSYVEEDTPVYPYLEVLNDTVLEVFSGDWVVKDNAGIDDVSDLAQRIERAELHVTLAGALYGTLAPNDERSYVHLEFDIANGLSVPSFAAILPDTFDTQITAQMMVAMLDDIQKQQAFRQHIQDAKSIHLVSIDTLDTFVDTITDYLTNLKQLHAVKAETTSPTASQQEQSPMIISSQPTPSFFSDEDHTHIRLDERTLFKELYKVSSLDEEQIQYLVQQPLARQQIGGRRYETLSLEAQLERLGLMRHGMLLYGTFLCFARSEFLRDHISGLQMVVYDNIKRGATNNTSIALAQANLIHQFDEAMDFLENKSNLQRAGNIGTSNRDELEIPVLALREAVANAIVHRSYTTELRHDPTRVEVYPDRLEVTSFGGFMKGITAQKLAENPERVRSRRRNPIIARIFQYMALVELNASGVSRIFSTTNELGLRRPEIDFDDQDETVRIVFYRRTREQIVQEEVQRLSAFINSTDRERVATAISTAETSAENEPEFANRFTVLADLLKAQSSYLQADRLAQEGDLDSAYEALAFTLPDSADDELVQRVTNLRTEFKREIERRQYVAEQLDSAEKALEDDSVTALSILEKVADSIQEREQRRYDELLKSARSAVAKSIAEALTSRSISQINQSDIEEAIKSIEKLGDGFTQREAITQLQTLQSDLKIYQTELKILGDIKAIKKEELTRADIADFEDRISHVKTDMVSQQASRLLSEKVRDWERYQDYLKRQEAEKSVVKRAVPKTQQTRSVHRPFWMTDTPNNAVEEASYQRISVAYNNANAVNDIDLSIYRGETLVITGNSGSGKSTLLSLMDESLPETASISGRVMRNLPVTRLDVEQVHNMPQHTMSQINLLDFDNNPPTDLIAIQEALGYVRASGNYTLLIATADSQLASAIASRIAVLDNGILQQTDTPKALYYNPSTTIVAQHMGDINLLDGKLVTDKNGSVSVQTADLQFSVSDIYKDYIGRKVIVGIRPTDIEDFNWQPPGITPVRFDAVIDTMEFHGHKQLLYLDYGRQTLKAKVDARTDAQRGRKHELVFNADNICLFDQSSKINLANEWYVNLRAQGGQ